jgi:hypothetical protein
MVQRRDRAEVPRSHPEVVLGVLRQRAWEQSRAAESGLAAVEVIERRVKATALRAAPRHADWRGVLHELASQLDTGAVYHRDLSAITAALNEVVEAHVRLLRVTVNARPTDLGRLGIAPGW